jgi:hypothetical protein
VSVGFTYWRGKKDEEVDIVADVGGRLVPFEVKHRHQHTTPADIKGLVAFCSAKKVPHGYVVTREMDDFGVQPFTASTAQSRLLKIPAPLACYWLGQSELQAVPQPGLDD